MKIPKKYSKKAKKVVSKYADGGAPYDAFGNPILKPTGEIPAVQVSGPASALPPRPMTTDQYAADMAKRGASNNTGASDLSAGAIGSAANGVAEIGSEIIDKNVNVDNKTGKNVIGKEIGKDVLKRGAQGASIGATIGSFVPVVGTAVGAGIGAGIGAIGGTIEGAVVGTKKKKAIVANTAEDLQAQNAAASGQAYGFKKGGKVNGSLKKSVGGGIGVALGPGVDATKAKNKKKLKFSDGGKIEGKGTAKSDDIEANVDQGSFIVPAENSKKAEKLRTKYLGSSDKKAKLKDGGGIDVMLSNGEHMFSPEEVKILKSNGVDVEALAPNAEAGHKKQDGGEVDEFGNVIDEETIPVDNTQEQDVIDNTIEAEDTSVDNSNDIIQGEAIDEGYKKGGKIKYQDGGEIIDPITFEEEQRKALESIDSKKTKDEPHVIGGIADINNLKEEKQAPPKGQTAGKKIFDALGGVAGIASLGQTGLGLAQLYGRKRPIGSIDAQLLKQQQEALTDATTGLSPEENALARQDIENVRRADVKNIIGLSGGNAGVALANIGTAGTRAQRGLLDLGVRNERLKMAKKQRADQLTGAVARNERQLLQDDLNAFNQNQQAAANLTQAGLSNFFGSLAEQKAQKAADERAKKYGNTTIIASPYTV